MPLVLIYTISNCLSFAVVLTSLCQVPPALAQPYLHPHQNCKNCCGFDTAARLNTTLFCLLLVGF